MVSQFDISLMGWDNPVSFSYSIDEEPFANGAFRAAYKAKIPPMGIRMLSRDI